MCWTPLYANKTCTLLQTTGGKDEPNLGCILTAWFKHKTIWWYPDLTVDPLQYI